MKANSNRKVLKAIRAAGAGVDVVSGGEIKRALECGFEGRRIIFSGVGKTHDEITLALRQNILLFNIEGPQELERIGILCKRLKKKARVSFRLNPNVNPKTHPYITTGFRQNKFGMDKSFLPELLKILSRYKGHLELSGLDFHIGSQLTELKSIVDAARKTQRIFSELRSKGYPLRYLDIGGGVGISYDGKKTIDIAEYGRRIDKTFEGLDCEILTEPGRFLVGDAGVLLTRVEYIKKTPYKTFVIVDTGMHHLLRPALYNAFHRILPVTRRSGSPVKVDVVGPICESSDWIGLQRPMVLPRQGDLIAILDAGAYGYVMASDYNLRDKPDEVVLD